MTVKAATGIEVRVKMVTTALDRQAIADVTDAWRLVAEAHARIVEDALNVVASFEAVRRVMDRLPDAADTITPREDDDDR